MQQADYHARLEQAVLLLEGKHQSLCQELHEKIRQLSMEAGRNVKVNGLDNNLLDLIAADDTFHLTKEQLQQCMNPERYTGRSKEQVEDFLAEVINPILAKNKEDLGMTAEINV